MFYLITNFAFCVQNDWLLQELDRGEFTINGWSPKSDRVPAEDVTATASWTEKPTVFDEIVLGKELKEIMQAYTQEDFPIEKFEADDKTRGSLVIAKFTDNGKAEEFVRSINEIERPENNFIKQTNLISAHDSFSSVLNPLVFVTFIVI